jgi:hypothetical protein
MAQAGLGGSPGGLGGSVTPGAPGADGTVEGGFGGGLLLFAHGAVAIDNTTITGNHATTRDNDVSHFN